MTEALRTPRSTPLLHPGRIQSQCSFWGDREYRETFCQIGVPRYLDKENMKGRLRDFPEFTYGLSRTSWGKGRIGVSLGNRCIYDEMIFGMEDRKQSM